MPQNRNLLCRQTARTVVVLRVSSSYRRSNVFNARCCLDYIRHKDEDIFCVHLITLKHLTSQRVALFRSPTLSINPSGCISYGLAIEALQPQRTDPIGKPQPVGYGTRVQLTCVKCLRFVGGTTSRATTLVVSRMNPQCMFGSTFFSTFVTCRVCYVSCP